MKPKFQLGQTLATPGALTRFDGERFSTFWSENTPELQSGELARLHVNFSRFFPLI